MSMKRQPGRPPSFYLNRRRLLRSGGLGMLGMNIAGLLRAAAPATASAPQVPPPSARAS